MADVITRFKLETTQYDSKLRDASKNLAEFSRKASLAGNEFAKFSKEGVANAKAFGAIATSATNAKDKVKELVGAYNDMAKAYNMLTKEQQQSDFGKAIAASMQQLQGRIREAKQELYGLDGAIKSVNQSGNTFNQLLSGVAGKFGMSASMFTGVGAAVAGVGVAYKLAGDNIRTALNFEKSLSQLSSLTGKTGEELDQLKEYAIELGATTTLSASQVADAFRLIGSQQPQLLASGEALKEVTKYAITLSEAAGIDLQTASQTLSTSINQMGGDSAQAARYINVLAAASQQGAGDIAWLGEAITKSATAAKAVGTDYEELVANLEQLAKAGFDASTAGTALRSIIMNLEKQANQEYKPSVVGLTQAFENLAEAHLSIVDYQQIAGKMFATQAMALANAAGEAKNMTEAISGTNTAEEQAKTNTDNLDGSLKSLASAWEGLNLHINNSNGILKIVVDGLKDVVTWADKAITGLGQVKGDRARLNNENGGGPTRIDRQINALGNTDIDKRQARYSQQMENYWRYINEWEKKLKEAESRNDLFAWETIKKDNDIATAKANIDGAKSMLKEYQSRAQELLVSASPAPGNNGRTVDLTIDVDTTEGTKSIKALQDEIKKLKDLRDKAANSGDTRLRDQYNAQIKSVQAEIKAMRGGGVGSHGHVKTEVETNNDKIKALTQEYQKVATAEKTASDTQLAQINSRKLAIQSEIKILQDRNKELALFAEEAQGKRLNDGSLPALTQQLKELQTAASQAANGREWEEYQKKIETITNKINVLKGVLPKDQQATFTVDVNAEQLEQLRMLLPTEDQTIRINVEEGRVDLPKVPTKDETIRVNVEQGQVNLPKVPSEDETIKVNVEQGNVDLPNVPTDDKTVKVNVKPGEVDLPKVPTDETIMVNVEEGRVNLPKVPTDDETIKVNVEQGNVDLPKIPTNDETIRVNITANTADAMKAVRDLVGEIDGINADVKIEAKVDDLNVEEQITAFEKLQRELRINLSEQNMQIDSNTLSSLMKTAIQNSIDSLDPDFSSLHEKISEGMNIPDETWQGLQDQINEQLKNLGIEPIKIDVKTGNIVSTGNETEKSWKAAASAVASVGSAMQSIEDPSMKVAGTIAQAIASIALGYAQATTQAATLGPWAWVAFAASGMAQMISMISTIHSATGYADGGIIKGNSYSGDNIGGMVDGSQFVGLNAGELVLNQAQQTTLAQNLQGGNMNGLNLHAVLTGENIVLSANRYLKRTGQGELVTWK